MYRIDNGTAAGSLPDPTAEGPNPDGYFTGGNPGTGTPATRVDAEWLNMVQEEIAGVIEGAGDNLNKSDRGQLFDAIAALIAAGVSPDTGKLFSITESVKTGDYTIQVADISEAVVANKATAITFSLDPLTNFTSGDSFFVKNINDGVLTVDPNSSETIDGLSSIVLVRGEAAVVYKDSSGGWRTLFLQRRTGLMLHVRDEKPSGTDGGSFTSGADRTRDLNTVVINEIPGASLASNQITLPAGTYDVTAIAPGYNVSSHHRANLWNVTDGAALVVGTNADVGAASGSTNAQVIGRFTITATKTIELRHRCAGNSSFGSATSFGTEIYASVILRKVA